MLLFSVLFPVDELADEHDHGEDYQVPEVLHPVADQAGVDHEEGTQDRERGHHVAAQGRFVLCGAHPFDEDRDVHCVDGDNGQLGRVEAERHALEGGPAEGLDASPGLEDAGEDEIGSPERAEQQSEDRGVVRQIGLLVDLPEELGVRSLIAGCKRVDAAAAAEHQAVHGPRAGDRNEEVEDVAEHAAEDVDESSGCSFGHQDFYRGSAGHAYVVADIGHDYDHRADDQRLGQVALGVSELGIDGGRDDPAFIGEGGRADRREQGSEAAA